MYSTCYFMTYLMYPFLSENFGSFTAIIVVASKSSISGLIVDGRSLGIIGAKRLKQ